MRWWGLDQSGLDFEFVDREVLQNIWVGPPNIWTNSGKMKGTG